MTSPLLSVVVPVYNEIESLPAFSSRVHQVLSALKIHWEIIFCIDPCTDGTEDYLRQLGEIDSRYKILIMTRKFGQSACSRAGIDYAKGDAIVVMDCDLQDPPEVISSLVAKWENGAKIVLARRSTREGEPYTKELIAKIGYWFMQKFSHVPIPRNVGDFRLMDRSVVNELKKFKEKSQFLRGLISLTGFEVQTVEFERPPRAAGETKYNKYFGSFRMGMNGIVGFSKTLLEIVIWLGVLMSFLAIAIGSWVIAARLRGFPFPVGNASIIVSILFVGGINLLCMGVLGLYIGRIYDEALDRPIYIVGDRVNL